MRAAQKLNGTAARWTRAVEDIYMAAAAATTVFSAVALLRLFQIAKQSCFG